MARDLSKLCLIVVENSCWVRFYAKHYSTHVIHLDLWFTIFCPCEWQHVRPLENNLFDDGDWQESCWETDISDLISILACQDVRLPTIWLTNIWRERFVWNYNYDNDFLNEDRFHFITTREPMQTRVLRLTYSFLKIAHVCKHSFW